MGIPTPPRQEQEMARLAEQHKDRKRAAQGRQGMRECNPEDLDSKDGRMHSPLLVLPVATTLLEPVAVLFGFFPPKPERIVETLWDYIRRLEPLAPVLFQSPMEGSRWQHLGAHS